MPTEDGRKGISVQPDTWAEASIARQRSKLPFEAGSSPIPRRSKPTTADALRNLSDADPFCPYSEAGHSCSTSVAPGAAISSCHSGTAPFHAARAAHHSATVQSHSSPSALHADAFPRRSSSVGREASLPSRSAGVPTRGASPVASPVNDAGGWLLPDQAEEFPSTLR